MNEPALERLRTAVENMNDVEATFLLALRDEDRVEEVWPLARRVASARAEFEAAMDDPVIVRLSGREQDPR